MPTATELVEPLTLMFEDDGSIPNNPRLPLLIYRNAIDVSGTPDRENVIEAVFAQNGWGEMWRNGIFPYAHYHSAIHEVLGIARGRAIVRFGGAKGREIELGSGDVAVLPAGTGHQGLWKGPDLMVIGAYPPTGRYDLCRGSKAEHAKAVLSIARVPLPATDPIYGKHGPLRRLWGA